MSKSQLRSDEFGNLLMMYDGGRVEVKPKIGPSILLGAMDADGRTFVINCGPACRSADGGWIISWFAISAILEIEFVRVIDIESGQAYACAKNVYLSKCGERSLSGYLSVAGLSVEHWHIGSEPVIADISFMPSWIPCVAGWFYVVHDGVTEVELSMMNRAVPVLDKAWCDKLCDYVVEVSGTDDPAMLSDADAERIRNDFRQELLVRKVFCSDYDNLSMLQRV